MLTLSGSVAHPFSGPSDRQAERRRVRILEYKTPLMVVIVVVYTILSVSYLVHDHLHLPSSSSILLHLNRRFLCKSAAVCVLQLQADSLRCFQTACVGGPSVSHPVRRQTDRRTHNDWVQGTKKALQSSFVCKCSGRFCSSMMCGWSINTRH